MVDRCYHGGLRHNVCAVFHKELGFWDGNPATIFPLLPDDWTMWIRNGVLNARKGPHLAMLSSA